MVFRSLIRDIIIIYLAFEIVRGYLSHNSFVTINIMIATVVLVGMTIWFLLEKMGAIPSFSGSQ